MVQHARGLLIIESVDQAFALGLEPLIRAKEEHQIAGLGTITIAEIVVPVSDVLTHLNEVSRHIAPRKYYAHYIVLDAMYVVFPNTVSVVRKGDPRTAETARQVGMLFDIPSAQMRFEEMFEKDHPDK